MLGVIAACGRARRAETLGRHPHAWPMRRSISRSPTTIMGAHWARPETFRFGASGLHQVLLDAIAGDDGAPGERTLLR